MIGRISWIRRTEEDVRQPHSIEFQALAETGLVGTLTLFVFLAAGCVAAGSRVRQMNATGTRGALTIACVGMWLVWMVHTSLDGYICCPGSRFARSPHCMAYTQMGPNVNASDLAACAPDALRRSNGGDRKCRNPAFGPALSRSRRRASVDGPVAARDAARSALKLEPDAPDTYYVLAAAQARGNDYSGARATLRELSRRKPHDFIAPALMGDLALRRGDLDTARSDYKRALHLNPRSSALQASLRNVEALKVQG